MERQSINKLVVKYHIMEKYRVNAVLDDEIIEVLKTYEIYDTVMAGDYYCFQCGKNLTIQDIGSVHVINRLVKLKCDDENCHEI